MELPHAEPTFDTISAFFPKKDWLERTVRAVPEHGVVYVKNPKAGCTTVTLWLTRIRTGDSDYLPDNVHLNHRLATLSQLGDERLVRMLPARPSGSASSATRWRGPSRCGWTRWCGPRVRDRSCSGLWDCRGIRGRR